MSRCTVLVALIGSIKLLGPFFVLAGLVRLLCDKWQTKLVVQGKDVRTPHVFYHVFLLWWISQFMQMGLYFIWNAISKNRCGLGRLKHGELEQPGNRRAAQARAVANDVQGENDIEPFPNDPEQQDVEEAHIENPDDDEVQVHGEDNENGAEDGDRQPLLEEQENQAGQDFAVPRRGRRNVKPYSKLVYLPPAIFDMAHMLLLYFGLKLTYDSSFIMLKGTIGFFVALLSMAFLAQPLAAYVWIGVTVTAVGFAALGISDYVFDPPEGFESYGIAAGDLLIAMSQIMFATKLVYEEKFVRKHSIHPMHFLGCEGFYGFTFATIVLVVFNFVNASQYSELPNNNIEDVEDAWIQFTVSWELRLAVFGSLLSFILYRYLGLFLVRDYGALPRTMLELFMNLIFWSITLGIDWNQFFYKSQAPAFVTILIGLSIYSHIFVMPSCPCIRERDNLGQEPFAIDDPFLLNGGGDIAEGLEEENNVNELEGAVGGVVNQVNATTEMEHVCGEVNQRPQVEIDVEILPMEQKTERGRQARRLMNDDDDDDIIYG